MIYNYNIPQEFIKDTDKLLQDLEERGFWDDDTYVVALDKSVRPLANTLKKLSKEKGKQNPKIRYFNYSARDQGGNERRALGEENPLSQRAPEKVKNIAKESSSYGKVLFLDEYVHSGDSLRTVYDAIGEQDESDISKPSH